MEPATKERENAIPLLQTLGIRLVENGERHAVMEVTVADGHRNFFGGAHGGLIATLVDTACFFPLPLLPAGRLVTTSAGRFSSTSSRWRNCMGGTFQMVFMDSSRSPVFLMADGAPYDGGGFANARIRTGRHAP